MKYQFFFLFLFLFSRGISQEQDAAFWPGIKLNHEFGEKIESTIFIQERVEENVSKHSNLFIDFNTSYKLNRNIAFELAYVFVNHINLDKRVSFELQLYTDINFKLKLTKHWKLKYIPIYQIQWKDVYSSATGKIPDYYWRNKFGIEYRLKKRILPYTFIESRTVLNQPEYYFNRMRYCVGCNFVLHHQMTLDFYYMLQHNFNDNVPGYLYIVGFNFSKNL